MTDTDTAWREANRANWDERVPIHLASKAYDLADLRAGRHRLHAIEEAELGPVEDLRILHLQCHFGRDTLTLAQRGAEVVGLDFSPPAIAEARRITAELSLEDRARFVEADVYAAPEEIPEPAAFDLVFTTWGTIGWLPDIRGWARVVAHFLKPGGELYFADGHPAALVLDDRTAAPGGMPGWTFPYFHEEPLILEDASDYADETARLENARTYEWTHPVGGVVTALIDAGLSLSWLHEHDAVVWRMHSCLVRGEDGMYRWPRDPWLPLSYSLKAVKRG